MALIGLAGLVLGIAYLIKEPIHGKVVRPVQPKEQRYEIRPPPALHEIGETSPVRPIGTGEVDGLSPEILQPVEDSPEAPPVRPALGHRPGPIKKGSPRLVTIRAARHDGYGSIVFQFSERVSYEGPRVDRNRLVLKLINVLSGLNLFRKYRSFDSWVRLEKDGNDLNALVGLPKGFQKVDVFLIENPYRLVVNLYYSPMAAVSAQGHGSGQSAREGRPALDKGDSLEQETLEEDVSPMPPDERQVDLIRARIFSRKGFYEKALHLYRDLRKRYPADEEIWEDYIETLANNGSYDLALAEIDGLLQKNPSNLRGQRIKARIYYEVGLFGWTFPIYENILKSYERDVGIWSDYAFARQGSGQWALGLDYLCRVLELDPDNKDALRTIHEILREHRPRFETGFRPYVQESDDSQIDISFFRYTQHVTRKTNIDLDYSRISAYRPGGPGLFPVDRHIRDLTLRLRHRFDQRWDARVGGGFYSGVGGGGAFFLGLGYSFPERGTIRASYLSRRPWYDPIEAAGLDGYYDRGSLSFNWDFGPAWGLYLGAYEGKYYAKGPDNGAVTRFGRRRSLTGILTRRLSDNPDLSVSYSYYRSKFDFRYDDYRPIPMMESEKIHSLSFDYQHWPCTYWGFSLSGGFRRHMVKENNSWYALPGIRVRLGNRIESGLSYEYSTESETERGGKTETLYFDIKVIL